MTFNGLMAFDVSIANGFSERGRIAHDLLADDGHGSGGYNGWTDPSNAVQRSVFMDTVEPPDTMPYHEDTWPRTPTLVALGGHRSCRGGGVEDAHDEEDADPMGFVVGTGAGRGAALRFRRVRSFDARGRDSWRGGQRRSRRRRWWKQLRLHELR
jgi:hypothetical protein